MIPDVNEIWKEVKENNEKLETCEGHSFGSLHIRDYTFNLKLTCKNCGGQMGVLDIMKYMEGFEHAGGDSDVVLVVEE